MGQVFKKTRKVKLKSICAAGKNWKLLKVWTTGHQCPVVGTQISIGKNQVKLEWLILHQPWKDQNTVKTLTLKTKSMSLINSHHKKYYHTVGWCPKLKLDWSQEDEVSIKPNSLFFCSSSKSSSQRYRYSSLIYPSLWGQTFTNAGSDTSLLISLITIFMYYCCCMPSCWKHFYLKETL